MAKKRIAGSGDVEFNMTPMIDVTFQLIIFFIIAGQMVNEKIKALIPPNPYESMAVEMSSENTVIVNIVSRAGNDPDARDEDARKAEMWFVEGEEVEVGKTADLVTQLLYVLSKMPQEARDNPIIEIRCDHRVQYSDVETVLLAARDAGIPDMRITAIVKPPQQE